MSTSFSRPVAGLMTALGLLMGLGLTVRDIIETDFPVDMLIYRDGVRAFMEGREMYTELMHAGDVALPFIYPPFGALVMVPLTAPPFMTDFVAAATIIATGNALILWCLHLAFRAVTPKLDPATHWAVVAVSWGFACLIEPVQLNNGFAQINVVIMALVVIDLIPWRGRRWLPQGTLVGIAAAIKLTPLVFGLFWLLRKDWRSIFTAGVSAVACTLLAALFRFDATMQFYFSTLIGMGTESEIGVNTAYQSNSSIKGMMLRFAPSAEWLEANGGIINVIALVLLLATIVLAGWLMHRLLRRDLVVDAVLVNAMVALLISPVSWSHHWVWLALILPVFAYRVCDGVYSRSAGWVLAIWAVLVVTVPPKWWFGDSIDVHALSIGQKILVSDFVWLACALMILVGVSLKKSSYPQHHEFGPQHA